MFWFFVYMPFDNAKPSKMAHRVLSRWQLTAPGVRQSPSQATFYIVTFKLLYEREKDTRHQTWRIPNFAQDMNVMFLEEKKKKKSHLLSLIKCKYTVAKAFIDFLLVFKRAMYVCRSWTPTVEPWKPALVACSSRLQYRCPSPRCLQLRYRWYTQRWLSVGW